MIPTLPRIVHQIWLQGDPPAQYKEMCASYKAQQQFGWEYRLWDADGLQALIEQQYPQYNSLWGELTRLGQKADLGRYLLMHHFGGMYADVDSRLLVNLDFVCSPQFEQMLLPALETVQTADEPLCPRQSTDVVVSAEAWMPEYMRYHHAAHLRKINNGILMSKPGLQFWLDFIDFAAPARERSVLGSFGVNAFTEFVYRHLLDCWAASRLSDGQDRPGPRIVVLPPRYCGMPTRTYTPTVIVHYCDGNWRTDAEEPSA